MDLKKLKKLLKIYKRLCPMVELLCSITGQEHIRDREVFIGLCKLLDTLEETKAISKKEYELAIEDFQNHRLEGYTFRWSTNYKGSTARLRFVNERIANLKEAITYHTVNPKKD